MASSAIKGLAFGAALFGGLQAGATANRAFVLLAAWERLGVIPWVNFTRAENVGVGALFYPVLGLAALLFTVSAAIAFRLDRTAPSAARAAFLYTQRLCWRLFGRPSLARSFSRPCSFCGTRVPTPHNSSKYS